VLYLVRLWKNGLTNRKFNNLDRRFRIYRETLSRFSCAASAAINEGYVGTLPMNEALKNRFVVIQVDYIDGDILKDVIKQQSQLQDDAIIEQIIKFNEDLRTMSKQGQISEEAASIRALIDLSDLITVMPIERAIKRTIIDKLEDEREQQAIKNAIELNF
ncbi:CbbQ/NirQ/NorQ domain-containing protein, partial [Staphylococcus haemolyticus]